MSDNSTDDRHAAVLAGDELRNAQIPMVRKGGLDADVVVALLGRAATTIDTLYVQGESDAADKARLAGELDELRGEVDRLTGLLAGAPASAADEAAGASTMLAAAQRVATETIDAAKAEAELLVADARAAAAAAVAEADNIRASARSDAEAEVAGLAAEITSLRAERALEHAELEEQLEAFRQVALEVHTRAAGSLEAALAVLHGYVAGEADSEVDTTFEGTDPVADGGLTYDDASTAVVETVVVETAIVETSAPADTLVVDDVLMGTVAEPQAEVTPEVDVWDVVDPSDPLAGLGNATPWAGWGTDSADVTPPPFPGEQQS